MDLVTTRSQVGTYRLDCGVKFVVVLFDTLGKMWTRSHEELPNNCTFARSMFLLVALFFGGLL